MGALLERTSAASGFLICAQHLRLDPDIQHLESQGVPAARPQIPWRLSIPILDAGNPVRDTSRYCVSLTLDPSEAHLREARTAGCTLEKAHRLDAYRLGTAILVHVERRARIGPAPLHVHRLVEPGGIESTTFLVVALGERIVES